MSESYLVAHKVRGEPAFDIAERVECSECHGMGCLECDDLGYWWIVPTSGHRAYPFASAPLKSDYMTYPPTPDLFNSLPDHYQIRSTPTIAKRSLLAELGLNAPTVKINRRI
jgi:hypothetical protein